VINMAILTLMVAVVIAIMRQRNLFAVVILGGVYSFLMATVMLVLDAVDVAMTEAAVGAGISTVLMLATLHLTKTEEAPPRHRLFFPIVVSLVLLVGLVIGTFNLPRFGDPETPMHTHVADRYIADAKRETGVPNVVTAVLASYRGYDTLGEATVIFTGAIGVLLLLSGRRKRKRERDQG